MEVLLSRPVSFPVSPPRNDPDSSGQNLFWPCPSPPTFVMLGLSGAGVCIYACVFDPRSPAAAAAGCLWKPTVVFCLEDICISFIWSQWWEASEASHWTTMTVVRFGMALTSPSPRPPCLIHRHSLNSPPSALAPIPILPTIPLYSTPPPYSTPRYSPHKKNTLHNSLDSHRTVLCQAAVTTQQHAYKPNQTKPNQS